MSRTAVARLLGAAACVAVLGLSTACGSGATAPAAAPAAPVTVDEAQARPPRVTAVTPATPVPAAAGSTDLELYAVQTGTLGVVVTDGEGRVLYGSDGDQTDPPQSHCTDACAQTWLPLTVPAGQEPQLLGVDEATVVGRLARPDGSSQLTLGGWPVYVNRNDDGQLKRRRRACRRPAGSRCRRPGTKVALPRADAGALRDGSVLAPPQRTSRRRGDTAHRYRASHHPISGCPIR